MASERADIKKQIRHRTRASIFSFSHLSLKSNLKMFFRFRDGLEAAGERLKILDLGCGYKPFQGLFGDGKIGEYVGVDTNAASAADIVGPIDRIAYPDDHFDGIIASQVFEHVLKLETSINELRRLAKPGALVYLSSPFVFQEHGVPYDYQRLTRYKYQELFKNDEIISLEPTNCNLGTPFFVFNACWALTPLKRLPLITQFYYLSNNLLGLAAEVVVKFIQAIIKAVSPGDQTRLEARFNSWFYSLPAGYNLIIKIKK